MITIVVSGGQTGADRGALDAAAEVGVERGGVAPRGYRAEDGTIPERHRSEMSESASAEYLDRTRSNVESSDGTLLVTIGARLTGGTASTRAAAQRMGKPWFHVALEDDGAARMDEAVRSVLDWVHRCRISVLNVAGSRESKEPGIGEATRDLVRRLLLADRAASSSPRGSTEVADELEDLVDRWHQIVAGTDQLAGGGHQIAADAPSIDGDPENAEPSSPIEDEARVDAPTTGDGETSLAIPERRIAPASSASSWSADQEAAIRAVSAWMKSPSGPQVFRLAGAAGTGKTTLVKELVSQARGTWLYAAYTGKAALVMRQRGCAGARTIHSLIYRPVGDQGSEGDADKPSFRRWDDSPLRLADGIVIDEGSMVDEEMGIDLLSFGKKILFIMDPDQLPPIEGTGYFTSGEPDILLTEIHRQSRDSGILEIATFVRQGGDLTALAGWRSADGCEVVERTSVDPVEVMSRMVAAEQVLVGANRTRVRLNRTYRTAAGATSLYPMAGDRVICLRNERATGLLNGSAWIVQSSRPAIDGRTVRMDLRSADDVAGFAPTEISTCAWTDHFLGEGDDLRAAGRVRMAHQEFDFGYAITVHKAQGSQWSDVVVYDESRLFGRDTQRRWLYTGITRAQHKITVFV